MKIVNSVFGNERKELEKFNKLGLDERSIVFYSEDISSFVHFEQIIHELTEKMGYQICYVTSAKDDPILTIQNKRIKAFYIGLGAIRTKFFMELKAGVLVMTMPNLETYFIKRSKVYPVHYVYVFHSIVSTHTIYRKGAFDHFDSIFCVGPHHVEEIRATESVYNLNHKNLVRCGYGLLDNLQTNKSVKNQQECTKDGKKKILIAPSWGKKGLLETKGLELVKILLDAGYHVTVRPHPMTIRKWPKTIEAIENKFKSNANFEIEKDVSSFKSLYSAYGLISDWSGIAMEYAFAYEIPVLYIDGSPKINNSSYDKIPCKPLEIIIRNLIGKVISPNELESLPKIIESTYENIDNFKTKIQEIREKTVFNLGESGMKGAQEIVKILHEKKSMAKLDSEDLLKRKISN
uniref:CDP-glycerol:poly(Glycerophosphate) glycerophosphotransferase (YidC, spoIIIJ, OXA1) n=1 Tax=uncultured marine thaumarchaeote KM3_13_H10 TaxID=1456008 RepID=A0A075GCI6_9ARCH|nr:CDP-glycerol:poly(glycerophosphate) glycerophosphotransferase (yidC, spoIIIJ, OXA1) [uncultured marine thaumarchaeote KM3_13_H10]